MASIFQAIARNELDEVQQMLTANPQLHKATDELGNTPLHEAARLGRYGIASRLLQAGADINAKGDQGNTPLHLSAEAEQNPDVTELLVRNGADIDRPNKHGQSPLYIAASQNRTVAELLLRLGAVLDLNSAILLERVARVNELLEKDPGLRNVPFPNELFWEAVRQNSIEMLKILANQGLRPNSRALFAALESVLNGFADLDMLQLLLESGADPNGKLYGNSGETPLQYARAFENERAEKAIALLKEYGASD